MIHRIDSRKPHTNSPDLFQRMLIVIAQFQHHTVIR
jgi:hypothetical protein